MQQGGLNLKLTLTKDGKDNDQNFFKHVSSKKKTRENAGLLLNKVMEDTEKEELLNVLFASVLTAEASLQNTRSWRQEGKSGERKPFPQLRKIRLENE